jgi:pimeloyl-ACP methyl ester carboxylesterase
MLSEYRTPSADGVEIANVAGGAGVISLLFIHGGLANRRFWREQLTALAPRYRVVALDLAGHGTSGVNRTAWTIAAFAADVAAVADALALERVVLIGNSLGGAVALAAAPRLGGRAVGVIGVDTLHDLGQVIPAEWARARAEAFLRDHGGTCRAMAEALFHPGAHPELLAWAEREMRATPAAVAAGMMEGFASFDLAEAARAAGVPVHAINGDLWPTSTAANRAIVPTFDAAIMKDAGHYPMLERPDEFNRLLVTAVERIAETHAMA